MHAFFFYSNYHRQKSARLSAVLFPFVFYNKSMLITITLSLIHQGINPI
ncbi:conserved hypothetical protein [Aggregatibacter segnis ATCC 33393]|uniref:Uncharacterized protein n=1 Tax=Aggregatibacter segnis ATCC 33393 TaxID=888057 RepID=E6KV49_9PAST|nr:conserved hypothetical protein [Aggregatibacter segnis ATCC 33393]